MIFYLAWRNLIRQRQRYALVALAVVLGFALVCVVSGTAFGALEALKAKGARYFAGEVSVQGFPDGVKAHQRIDGAASIASKLRNSSLGIRSANPRAIYYGDDASLLFGGESVRQRRLAGIDFAAERAEFAGLAFVDGDLGGMIGTEAEQGILISESAAKILGAHNGDEVTIALSTDTGQYNTGTLVVRGIFRETSLFGYIAYVQIDELNKLVGRPKGTATDLALYGFPGGDNIRLADAVRTSLGTWAKVFPSTPTKDSVDVALNAGVSDETYSILPLEGNLKQIGEIVSAFLAVTLVALGIFAVIVMVGILNTFRVIAYERTREVGTMRALGMQRRQVSRLFLAEALIMGVVSCASGLALAMASFGALSLANFSHLSVAGLFMEQGHLRFFLDPLMTILDFGIMLAATLVAAWGPAHRASAVDPAVALRTEV